MSLDVIRLTRTAIAIFLYGAALGCGNDRFPIEEVREGPASGRMPVAPVSSAERFGFRRRPAGSNPHGAGVGRPAFHWKTPAGWTELSASKMRIASFRIDGRPDTDASLSTLPGAAGGVAANVNRWRKQMGLSAMPVLEIASLPQFEFLGSKAVFVDLEGSYRGMGNSGARDDSRLLGLVLEQPGRTVFLKLTGPSDTIAAERPRFLALAASVREAEPASHPDVVNTSGSTGTDRGGLRWEVPGGWMEGPARSMRLVTFLPRGRDDTECYVTILRGGAGGVGPNINRWRSQLGLAPLGAAGFGKLQSLKVLRRDAALVELQGSFTGMGGKTQPDAALLGVVCPLEGSVLFVKMTGPKEVVTAERDRFLAFCRSLNAQ